MPELPKQALPPWLPEEPPGLAVTRSLLVWDGLRHQSKTREPRVQPRLPPTPSYAPWLTG